MAEMQASGTGTSDEPLIGSTINGRYRVISLIARGGMGKVFKAEQFALGRVCALKILSPKYQGDKDPDFHRRFSLEAAIASKLSHPNTVTIFDHGKCEEHDVYYIAMEYLDGRTLHQALHAEGVLPEARANRIAQQICRSVAEAHTRGVVHRDLKPGNVMLLEREDEQDVVKVLDFGLVKDVTGEVEDLTQTGLFMGSPKYMSPEQITGGEVSARTDVYAVGVILYEMITGKVPFDSKASMNTLMAHVNTPPPPLAARNPDLVVSNAMEGIIFRCLAKAPEQRFATMRELLTALKRAAGDITDTFESLPQIKLDAAMISGRESSAGGAYADRRSGFTVPPPSGSGTSKVLPGVSSAIAADSLAPPPSPPTVTGAMPRPRGPTLRMYGVAIAAAAVGGVISLALVRRQAPASGPMQPQTIIETVQVPVLVPAPSSDPTGKLRVIRIESEPPGAAVSDHGTEVCMSTPCELVWRGDAARAERQLTVWKRGYKPAIVTVTTGDEKVSAKLDAAPAGWQPTPGEVASSVYADRSAAVAASAAPSAVVSAAPSASVLEPSAVDVAPTAAKAAPTVAPAAPAAKVAPAVMLYEPGMSRPVLISGGDLVYSREAIAAKVQGTVIAKCIITTSGSVTNCRIVKGLPHMDEAVIAALSSRHYQPIIYQGQPVNVDYVFPMKVAPPP